MNRLLLLLLPLAILLSPAAFAGNTGKIAGKVTNEKTGEAIPGATVTIPGTTLGASANLDGEFTIINIPPGAYTVKASAIGYQPMAVNNVRVNIDLTTKVNFPLKETAVELKEEVVITAERPAVQKDLTASTAIVGAEQIATLPVTELSEVLDLQAGYLDGHLRGGRQGEIAYWIDGVPVTDVYDGSTVIDVNKNLTQELQLVSGAYNAEYGQAMSGIVNIATKEGGSSYNGSIGSYVGSFYSPHADVFRGMNQVRPFSIRNFEGSLSGPLPLKDLTFFLNGRYIYFGGWMYGERFYNPSNVAYIDSAKLFHAYRDPSGRGDGAMVPMNWNDKIYAQGKLAYRFSSDVKLWYTFILDKTNYEDYDQFYQFNPDGNPTQHRTGNSHIAQLTHVLSQNAFYTIGATYFSKDYSRYVYENMYDPRYVNPALLQPVTPYSFSTGGTDMSHFERNTKSLIVKGDFTSQITQRHLVKGGLEFRRHELYFNDITLQPIESQTAFNPVTDNPFIQTRVMDVSTLYHSEYTRRPMEFAAYLQDKMEFEDLIINIGLRAD